MILATLIELRGTAFKAMKFYEEALGGEILLSMLYDETTTDDEMLHGKVFHGEIKIKDFYLYFTDSYEAHPKGFSLCLECDSLEEAKETYEKLVDDGFRVRPVEERPYGPSIGTLMDKFGIEWNIIYVKNN
jgi:PhnB protein